VAKANLKAVTPNLPVARHYPVGLENHALGATADRGCGRPPRWASAAGCPIATAVRGHHSPLTMFHAFIFLLTLLIRLLRAACTPRDDLVLESLALR